MITIPTPQSSQMKIKFEGRDLEGVIDIYDLATTIMAFGNTIEEIAKNERLTTNNKLNIQVSALRAGSFEVDFIISLEEIKNLAIQTAPVIAFLATDVVNQAEKLVNIFKKVLEVKKFLKGERPKEIQIKQEGEHSTATIYNFTGDNMTINMPVYNALQDQKVNQGLQKMLEPLKKENNNVESILIDGNAEKEIEVEKDEITFFENIEELQSVTQYKVKGVVTAFDRKTGNGRISINDSKRISFEILYNLPSIEFVERNEMYLIESLKLKTPVILTGDAILDLEANLKKIKVIEVMSEAKLF